MIELQPWPWDETAVREVGPPPARRVLVGRELRYVLTVYLFTGGPMTVSRLVALLGEDGFGLRGRPSKVVSDALRWEIAWGRVVRIDRGRYGPGEMPASTARRIRRRVRHLRAVA